MLRYGLNKAEVSQGEKVTEGIFIFVAINDEGKPRAIECQT